VKLWLYRVSVATFQQIDPDFVNRHTLIGEMTDEHGDFFTNSEWPVGHAGMHKVVAVEDGAGGRAVQLPFNAT
jgi:hypothetical protein